MIGPITAILLGATAAPASYPGFEPLNLASDGVSFCTADDNICIATPQSGILTVTRDGKEIANWSANANDGDLSLAPTPTLFRLSNGRLLVRVLITRQTSYSGGGGSATDQVLVLIDPDRSAKPVLTVPEEGSLMIRACFTDKDFKHRAGACHDEYRFSGTLTFASSAAGGLPALSFRMAASHYPRGVSRDGDSLTLPPLHKADLTWQDDMQCTYQRTFRFDPASNQYVPNAALPDCSDYTQP